MTIKDYNKNREVFKQVSMQSEEGREKVTKIRNLKNEVDKNLDRLVEGGMYAAISATFGALLMKGNFVPWNYILGIIMELGAAGVIVGMIKTYKERKNYSAI